MKTSLISFVAILFVLTSATRASEGVEVAEGDVIAPSMASVARVNEGAKQMRDPFWPVGYRPFVETNQVEVVKEVEVFKPVGQEEWEAAKANIPRVSGIFIGEHPASGEMVEKMIFAGKTYYVGDKICLTNEFVAFTWKIDSISFKKTKYELSPVSAERVLKKKK